MKELNDKQKKFIDGLISKMTLEEKAGQLNQLAPSSLGGFTIDEEEQQKLLKAGRITEDDIERAKNARESFKEQEQWVQRRENRFLPRALRPQRYRASSAHRS